MTLGLCARAPGDESEPLRNAATGPDLSCLAIQVNELDGVLQTPRPVVHKRQQVRQGSAGQRRPIAPKDTGKQKVVVPENREEKGGAGESTHSMM